MSRAAWGDDQTRFFFELTPDRVLESVETAGLLCTGRCLALNSFENRVYDVELETEERAVEKHLPANRRVVKFYRPGRWTREQILEEHEFLLDLAAAEIPVVAPLAFPDGATLRQTEAGIHFALFPKVGGRAPDELSDEQLVRVGRLLARIHNVGASKQARHRVTLTPDSYGRANLEFLLAGDWIPLDSRARYQAAVESILSIVAPLFDARVGTSAYHRIHGDCHLGNLLWNDAGPFFLDFDDMVRGPAVQDMWLLVPGRVDEDEEARRQRDVMIEGYAQMREFDRSSLRLVEPLRALRFIHYSAWLARRWEDPAFPVAFPNFGTPQYWMKETQDLEEQIRRIRSSEY